MISDLDKKRKLYEDVALFCLADGNIDSFKIKKNVSKFLIQIFEPIINNEDWTVEDFRRAIEVKIQNIV